MTAQEKIEKDLKFKPAVDNPTNPGFIIDKRDPNEGTQITGYNKDGTPIEEKAPQYGKYPSYTKMPNDITTIEAQPQEDDLMSIYKKYIKPPKENKETENSLRRLAIGEAISKGIAGVGNIVSGKPTQYDSQPMSNTYLKSIEAADERRKRFDAQNHDYIGGMYNTAVDSWKYKKGEERQKELDARQALKEKQAQENWEKEQTDKNERARLAYAGRLKIAKMRSDDAAKNKTLKADDDKLKEYKHIIPLRDENDQPYDARVSDMGLSLLLKAAIKDPGQQKQLNIALAAGGISEINARSTIQSAVMTAVNNNDQQTLDVLEKVRMGGSGLDVKLPNQAATSNTTSKYESMFRK